MILYSKDLTNKIITTVLEHTSDYTEMYSSVNKDIHDYLTQLIGKEVTCVLHSRTELMSDF